RTGKKGRVAIYEVLVMDEALKSAIAANAPAKEIYDIAAKGGMTTFKDYAKILMAEGLAPVEEILKNLIVSKGNRRRVRSTTKSFSSAIERVCAGSSEMRWLSFTTKSSCLKLLRRG